MKEIMTLDQLKDKYNITTCLLDGYMIRYKYISNYGFIFPSREFIDDMVTFLNGKKVLSIMCGNGYFESLLKERGIDIIATDNKKWANTTYPSWKKEWMPIEQLSAFNAVNKYKDWADIVIMSWPYMDIYAYQIAKILHIYNIPLLYIGEDIGGCTADTNFFNYVMDNADSDSSLNNNYFSFPFIYDNVVVYNWQKPALNISIV